MLYGRKIQCIRLLNSNLVTHQAKQVADEIRQIVSNQIADEKQKNLMLDHVASCLEKPIKLVNPIEKNTKKKRHVDTTLKQTSDKVKHASSAVALKKFEDRGRGDVL